MQRLLTLLIVTLTAIGCGNKNEYTVSGTIADTLLNGKCVYMYDGDKMIDSAKITDNRFEFKGIADSVAFTEVTYDTQSWETYGILAIEPGNIEITLNPEKHTNAATGTILNDALYEYTSKKIAVEMNLKPKYEKIVMDNTLNKLQKQTLIDEINKMYFDQTKEVIIQTISKNLNNEVSALFLANHYPQTVNDNQFEELYSKLSDKIKTRHELKRAYQIYKTKTLITK